jgi:hypothetical protein
MLKNGHNEMVQEKGTNETLQEGGKKKRINCKRANVFSSISEKCIIQN